MSKKLTGKKSCLPISSHQGIESLESRRYLSNVGPANPLQAGAYPGPVAVADFNGDGKLDIVTANSGNGTFSPSTTVSILFGNGDGTFQSQATFSVGTNPDGVAVADFNGDGLPDIATANSLDGTVSVLLNSGHGAFQNQVTFAVGAGTSDLAVGDLTGDGHVDIVTTNSTDNTVSVLLGNGNGSFAAQTTYATGSGASDVVVADVNGDGNPDLVVSYSQGADIFIGNGNGTFHTYNNIAPDTNNRAVAVGDLNGDGIPDIVTTQLTTAIYGGTGDIIMGTGQGNFATPVAFAWGGNYARTPASGLPNGASGGVSIAIADVNGDGKSDLVVASRYGSHGGGSGYLYTGSVAGDIVILHGNGNGTFHNDEFLSLQGQMSSGYGVAIGDFNGDGRPDVVGTDRAYGNANVFLNTSTGTPAFAFFNNGVLSVPGTTGNDTIVINHYGGSITATLNGESSPPIAAGNIVIGISITGGAGNDIISLAGVGVRASVGGAGGNDMITGSANNDSLRGGAGDDTIGGAGGDDSIVGGGAGDSLKGGAGNDLVAGGPGSDTIHGGVGNDSLIAGIGDDVISGNDGNDSITAGSGLDQLFPGAGTDTVFGSVNGGGPDTIEAGSGNDSIFDSLSDSLIGQNSDDTVTHPM